MSKEEKAVPSESSAENEEAAKEEEGNSDTPAAEGDSGEELSERDKIYAKYNKDKTPEGSNQEADVDLSAATVESEEEAPEKKEEEPEKKLLTDEEKTVPHGAFHEEREKRKELQAKVIELEMQIKSMLTERKPDKKDTGTEDVIDDYDAELIKLKNQNEALQAKVDAVLEKGTQSDAEKAQVIFLNKIDKVDKELAEEGYDGFQSFTSHVKQHINDLIMKEPDPKEYIEGRKLLEIDNPEGWKKIYKEEIYPSIRKIFDQKDKDKLIDERIARKKKAVLSGSSGGKPVPKNKEDVNSLSQDEMNKRYMTMRKKARATV